MKTTKKYRALSAKGVKEMGLTQEYERDFTGAHKMQQRFPQGADGNMSPLYVEPEAGHKPSPQGEDKPTVSGAAQNMATKRISISVRWQTIELAVKALEFFGYEKHDLAFKQANPKEPAFSPEEAPETRAAAEDNYNAARELKGLLNQSDDRKRP